MVYRTILDALGNTPLIELNHMTTPDQARIVVKYEGLNVGGSIKTRTALQMIEGHFISHQQQNEHLFQGTETHCQLHFILL